LRKRDHTVGSRGRENGSCWEGRARGESSVKGGWETCRAREAEKREMATASPFKDFSE